MTQTLLNKQEDTDQHIKPFGFIQQSSSCSTLCNGGGNRKKVGCIEFSRARSLFIGLQINPSITCCATRMEIIEMV